jgi:hypothetical protein
MIEQRLGEKLVETKAVTEDQLQQALSRQRRSGGRIGENLVALGFLSAADLDAVLTTHPALPVSVADTGLDLRFIADLVMKHVSIMGDFTAPDVSERIKLPSAIVNDALEILKRHKYVEVKGSSDYSLLKYRYSMTGIGGARAAELLDICRYIGPAPVSIEAYRATASSQTVKHVVVDESTVQAAFANLVISDDLLSKIGPAVSAGRAIFVYGPPGNGKTTIAETIGNILPGSVYVPYALLVGGQIITIFDTVNHTPVEPARAPHEVDQRWILCRRPVILAGGELTMRMLDLDFNTISKFYEAPLQMKANNGLFIIDDFGRQLVEPRPLLNRWIVPLERRADFLGLHTGMKFEIPFDQLVVFSTNLDPKGLVDEAFLRRIRYKIKVARPTLAEYQAIFERVCAANGMAFRKDVFDHLIADYYRKHDVELNACHPRDLIDHIIDEAHYRNHGPELTPETIAMAWESYFVIL